MPGSSSPDDGRLDMHGYAPSDLLKLLAHILTHIATTNDEIQHSHYTNGSPTLSLSLSSSSPSSVTNIPPIWHTLTTAARTALTNPSSTLTFHARNVPTISLEAYLLRILKYCPTSNTVFLSLLVYFDRMSKLSLKALNKPFIIDSFNIHRLVIAGVTVASKFFSDVFYTNSRYAKVGGLPLGELNQLELQFLLLNDFRLYVSTADMQDYAEQLVLFARAEPVPSAPNLALPDIPLNGHDPPVLTRNRNGKHRSYPSPTSSPSPTPSPSPQLQPTRLGSSKSHSHIPKSNSHTHPYRSCSPPPPPLPPPPPPPPPPTPDTIDPETDATDLEDCDASTETDAETTVSSTSTDTDDEPTIRGPRTVVAWGDEGDRSP